MSEDSPESGTAPPVQIAGDIANQHIGDMQNIVRNLAPGKFSDEEISKIAHSFADNTPDSEVRGLAVQKFNPFASSPYSVDPKSGAVTLQPSLYKSIQNKITNFQMMTNCVTASLKLFKMRLQMAKFA